MADLHGFPRKPDHFLTSDPPLFGMLVIRLWVENLHFLKILACAPPKSDPVEVQYNKSKIFIFLC